MTTQNEETHALMLGFDRSTEYFGTHYDELCEKYPEHWVAIYDGELVGTSLSFYDLFDDLKAKGISLRSTLIDKIETEDVKWVFPS